jgi:hypothetical protein
MIICFEENHNKSTLVWAICEGHNTASWRWRSRWW